MSRTDTNDPTRSARPARATAPATSTIGRARRRVAAAAVLAGLALPLAGFGVADLVNPGWSPVERMVSYYVHAPRAGWLIPAGALVLAAASTGLLRLAAPRTRGGRTGLWLLGVWCAGLLAGGLFPTDPYGQWDRPPSVAGAVHGVAALTAFAVLPVAAVLLTRVWRRDIRRRPFAAVLTGAAALTVLAFLGFVVIGGDVMAGGPSLTVGGYESVAGLAERVLLWSYALWLGTAAIGLRHMPRQGR
ncbi:DUF998 domain-containing protein [Plantactinospora sp. WMMB334]|uniref:DUF998 domain-containing protein n=1 Tax=Plantactinospora sp. WMMB334 TaxID=3404119 RepID=UPI003B948A44